MLDRRTARRLALVPAAARRAAATSRKRRWRQRQRRGAAVLAIEVADLNRLIEVLIGLSWLAEAEAEDRKQIAQATAELLDDLAASWRREHL
jgi:hypothetical protein